MASLTGAPCTSPKIPNAMFAVRFRETTITSSDVVAEHAKTPVSATSCSINLAQEAKAKTSL
jgi:hypothetical protein